jgi:ceramide glucosyltransferase
MDATAQLAAWVSNALFGAGVCGVLLLAAQLLTLRFHLRGRWPGLPRRRPPISILKPLCGLDDELEANLWSFASLPYPSYEVLLGVRDQDDPAFPVAQGVARRWPRRFRVIVQQGEPGLNPKVNQLITLARAARHGLLVISDSNTRVPAQYLDEIAAHLADPRVGLVTHPLSGRGEDAGRARLGSMLDNLHLTGAITPGFAGAKYLCGKDYVVGKSMALRRADLEALGGFASVKDVLAEDFVLGRLIPERLGKRVVLARTVVSCVSVRRSVGGFVRRYARWSVMQRQCAGLPAYLGLLLLNPVVLGAVGLLLAPSGHHAAALGAFCAARVALDVAAAGLLGREPFRARALLAAPLRDLLAGAAWAHGLTSRVIEWRSNRLLVLRGSALQTATPGRFHRRRGSDRARASAAA